MRPIAQTGPGLKRRHLVILLAVAAALALPMSESSAATQAKRVRAWHGYGFLPGYRPPERIEREDYLARARRGPQYWYGYPRFYRGRWNGGGFGPCWTQTPIGPMWNCGR
jgi:hypothetical protein